MKVSSKSHTLNLKNHAQKNPITREKSDLSIRSSVDSQANKNYVTTTNSSDNRSLSARGRLIQNERPGSSLFFSP
ncbi:MAG: hypothetical protein ACOYK4_06925, partial [Candidatus Planktophila sp.]